jgi:hypothetical protein
MAAARRDGLLKYQKKATHYVIAVKLDLARLGFSFFKWGATQRAKPGDWLVDNDGDIYTVDGRSFARTYRRLGPGRYLKTSPVWACVADAPGRVSTKEGTTRYVKGDYLVSNLRSGADRYAVRRRKFLAMYRRVR